MTVGPDPEARARDEPQSPASGARREPSVVGGHAHDDVLRVELEDRANKHGHGHPHDGDHRAHGAGVTAAIRDLIRPHSHDSSTKIDSALESDARGVRALKISLGALLITGSCSSSS